MLFSSLLFIFVFLPIAVGGYRLIPAKWQNGFLLLMSWLFYGWGGTGHLLLILGSSLFNYLLGGRIAQGNTKRSARNWLAFGIIFNVGLLVNFKYLNFIIENLNLVFCSWSLPTLEIPGINLPLGISFFTFQAISYLMDVYRKETPPAQNWHHLALYIALFPQLIAGPIVRYKDLGYQIKHRKADLLLLNIGIRRFIIGLAKKILLADQFGQLADLIFECNLEQLSSPMAWLGMFAYAFQIYFDFSGYSDMAIGLGRMFGFRIPENFNWPYTATSIKDFWRRWHISLSQWFKDYLYVPLGGNRIGRLFTFRNLFLVFLLTGFWHGANWSFIIWGLLHGFLLILERIGWGKVLQKLPRIISQTYTFILVALIFVPFRTEDAAIAMGFYKALFTHWQLSHPFQWEALVITRETILLFGIGGLGAIGIWKMLASFLLGQWRDDFQQKMAQQVVFQHLSTIAFLVLLYLSTTYLLAESYNPFIYFRF